MLAATESASGFDVEIDRLINFIIDPEARTFKFDADILGATTSLVNLIERPASLDVKATVLNRISKKIGDQLFPAFIKLLMTVGESEDSHAKRHIAEAFGYCIQKGDVPSGTLSSWGIPSVWAGNIAITTESAFSGAARRNLDPIEFIVAWHSQQTDRPVLRDTIFRSVFIALYSLFDSKPEVARLYQAKLASDIINQPVGTFTDLTRERLKLIAEGWAAKSTANSLSEALLKTNTSMDAKLSILGISRFL